jgi:hypothetical protein
MSNIFNGRFLFIASAIVLAAVSRLLPHLPDVSPVAAMALFGGACLSDKRIAFIVPLAAMLLSDAIIGFHSTMLYVYGGFVFTVLMGIYMRNAISLGSVLFGSLLSSVFFFLLSNFGVWVNGNFAGGYAGLVNTYVLGVPFFRNTVFGDLFFNAVLFGGFYLAQIKFPKLAKI